MTSFTGVNSDVVTGVIYRVALHNIVIETSDYTADELITTALNDMEDDEFLSRICELNSHIIREAALYFVVVFAKNYGIDYNDFWNKFKL